MFNLKRTIETKKRKSFIENKKIKARAGELAGEFLYQNDQLLNKEE